jgi:hypothetical protein
MLGKNLIRKSITLLTAVAIWSSFSMVVLAASNDVMGEITVTGQVSVNGQSVVSNSIVTSGSSITTGTNSSAMINLGKIGRVEVLSDSSVTLRFTENSIVTMLTAGKVRISNAPGIATSVTTRNATVVADAGQANTFAVDTGCGNELRCAVTHVATTSGLVFLRSGTTDRQVAAGTDASFGNPSQTGCQPCLRPGVDARVPVAGIGTAAIAAILLAAGGAVVAAILLNNNNEDIQIGGGAVIISPTR